jgi:hypothetical protein
LTKTNRHITVILKNSRLAIGLLLIVHSKVFAQVADTIVVTYPDSLRPKLSYTINWDSRSSIIKEKRVNIRGINTGIIVGRNRHEITIGYYWMNFSSYLHLLDLRKKAAKRINLDYYTKTDMYFFSFMYWQNFINNRKWLVSVPIEVGMGAAKNQGVSLFNEIKIWKRKEYFIPVQAGIYIGWKATRWVGFSVQGGYRYALFEKNISENYNGLYYSFGANMRTALFGDIYRWTFKKKLRKKNIND